MHLDYHAWAVSPSRTFLSTLIGFIAGIALHSFGDPTHHWYPAALAALGLVAFASVLYFFDAPPKRVVALFVFALIVGVVRFDAVIPYGAPDEIGYYIGQDITVRGVVAAAPTRRLAATLQEISASSPGRGTLFLILPLSTNLTYGDEVLFSCTMVGTRGGSALCNHPNDFLVVAHHKGQRIIALLISIKDIFARGLVDALPEPHASLAAGILYGDHTIPPRVAQDFSITGVSHIIAASGYNIGIVSQALLWSLLWLPFMNFRRAFWVVAAGIALYTLIAGAGAAVVRAAVMGLIVLVASYLGRPRRATNVMMFSGAAMLAVNPRLLAFDVGFVLSFAATVGIVFVAPALKRQYRHAIPPGDFSRVFFDLLFATVGAVVLTMPIILWVFGNVSLVALPTNLLIVFVVPFAMLASFIVGLITAIFAPAGQIIMWIAWAPLTYMLDVAHLFASIPRASFVTGIWSRPLALAVAVVVVWWVWRLHRKPIIPAEDEPIGWQIEAV